MIHLSVFDWFIIAYLVMAVITTFLIYQRMANPWQYRLVFSCVLGVLWPLPVLVLAFLTIEGLIVDAINWFKGE